MNDDPAQIAYETFRDEYQLEYPEGLPTWLALPAKDRLAWTRIAKALAAAYPSEDDILRRIECAVEDDREVMQGELKPLLAGVREHLQAIEGL